MNEKFGVELKLLITQFTNKIKNAVTESKVAGKQIQDNLTVKPGIYGGYSKMTAQQVAEAMSKSTGQKWIYTGLNKSLEQTNEIAKSTGSNITNMFSKAEKSGKRFLLSLFGIRSIWSLISKAASSYMTTNDLINKKVELTTQIMGKILAPIIKKVVNFAQYAIIILAKVIQLFTGYNALANITADSLNKTAKASKNLSKTLASFDTITNLEDQTSGISDDIASSIGAVNDFQEKVDKVSKIFDKYKKQIKVATTALGIMFGVAMLAKIAKIIGVAGSGSMAIGASGLLGVLSVVGLLAVASILIPIAVKGVQQAISEMKEVGEAIDSITTGVGKEIDKSKELTKKLEENAKGTGALSKETQKYNEWIITQIDSYKVLSDEYSKQKNWLIKISDWLGITDGAYSKLTDAENKTKEATFYYVEELKKQYNAGNLSKDMIEKYKNKLVDTIKWIEEQNTKLDKNSKAYKENKNKVKDLYTSLEQVAGKDYVIKLKADTKKAEKDYSNFFSKLGLTISTTLDPTQWGKNFSKKIKAIWSGASYDVGTNYVPNDQLAMVHKGEMIVPKKYNPATSGIGTGNDETNRLLNKLIVTLEDKDMNAYISSNDVGRASVSYINEQSRIMGRKLI